MYATRRATRPRCPPLPPLPPRSRATHPCACAQVPLGVLTVPLKPSLEPVRSKGKARADADEGAGSSRMAARKHSNAYVVHVLNAPLVLGHSTSGAAACRTRRRLGGGCRLGSARACCPDRPGRKAWA